MSDEIKVGDIVTPITPSGLWLADVPINGDYNQKRDSIYVFKGEGKVLKMNKTIIDYDEWGEQDKINGIEYLIGVGKLEYIDLLIECDAGIGWGGLGAVTKVKEETK
jgi:hypothetical protein